MASILGSFKLLQPRGYKLAPEAGSLAELGPGGWLWALRCFLAQASPSLRISLWDVIQTGPWRPSVPLIVRVGNQSPRRHSQSVSRPHLSSLAHPSPRSAVPVLL